MLQKIEVVNGTIVVKQKSDFDELLNISKESRKSLVEKIKREDGFKNYTENHVLPSSSRMVGSSNVNDEEIANNAAFFDLLNADGIITVGNYTFRLDHANELLFVIANSNLTSANYPDFLSGNTSNQTVGSFPTYVDVFAAIDDGFTKMPSLSNQTSDAFRGMRGFAWHEEMYWDETSKFTSSVAFFNYNYFSLFDKDRMDGKIAYDRYGIFFHLYAKEKYQKSNALGLWYSVTTREGNTNWFVTYDAKFRVIRGNGTQIFNRIRLNCGYGVNNNDNQLDKTFYQGNRAVDGNGFLRWDVTIPTAIGVKVFRGTSQSNVSQVFFNKQNTPTSSAMNNFKGSYNTSVADAIALPFKVVY